MRSTRTWRVLAAASAAALATSLLSAPAATAVEFNTSRSILDSDCTTWLKWRGGFPENVTHPNVEPHGKVKLCWVKYRLKDRDPDARYYAVSLQSMWRSRGDSRYPAEMQQVVRSTVGSMDRVYGSTNSYTSSKDCSDSVTVSFGVGPFSASTTPKICDNYGIERYKANGSESYWRSDRAGGLRYIETAFAQKVPRGQVPLYDIVFAIPNYKVTFHEAAGYWSSSKRLKWKSWTDQ